MTIGLMLLLSLHVLSATFWAGSTFVLARTGGSGIDALRRPQFGAAGVAIVTGVPLAVLLHGGAFGRQEQVLAVAVAAAVIALVVQIVDRGAPARSQRIAGGLLIITILGMVVARYVA
ncbi:hypothetical protein [Caulobacter sp. UNC279MFTsu5.1]|uniref:hypothetical protein n=1 Tax=Caulobacter sp. UNC279MFTsu5.1 TaxID=1502775 RepID=UPI0003800F3B|nr:hypothetical protein [Caulobacter sp. UNC279MFTsu5.1]SFJ02464.1 hypothetical protein SAMN02799626_00966 [Caulobacter sp. UNC279MFTsu5.1]